MTQEEKAKRYDEAIKVAKSNYETIVQMDNDCTFAKEGIVNTFHHIFPELKESEDKKWIPKEIAKYLKEKGDFRSCWIAWLEKQGDKVSAIEGFETEFERQVSCLIASAINKEHEYNDGYVKWTANALLNYAKHELEKQGEQKPANKVEPKFEVGDKIKLAEEPKYPAREIIAIKNNAYYFDRLVHLPFSNQDEWELVEQKPAWSEEDEKMCQETIDWFEKKCFPYALENDNPARESIKWLKSLRHQNRWKPSDEQMEALKEAVDAEIVEVEDNNYSMCAYTHLEICTDEDLSKICKAGDKAKVIIIKQK